MAKIIKFKTQADNIQGYLKEFIKMVKRDKIDNIMICCKDKQHKEMCTGYFNLDMGQKMEMVGHIQADITDEMIRTNINDYVEYID
jgi:putative heme iron utilization protein